MSDGAKISCMPLVNNIVICADVPPTVVDIHDCTDYIVVGGKKDAEYLAGIMEEAIFKFDPERMNTYVFYFDGAANVQNSCLRLCTLYQRAYVMAWSILFHSFFLYFKDRTY